MDTNLKGYVFRDSVPSQMRDFKVEKFIDRDRAKLAKTGVCVVLISTTTSVPSCFFSSSPLHHAFFRVSAPTNLQVWSSREFPKVPEILLLRWHDVLVLAFFARVLLSLLLCVGQQIVAHRKHLRTRIVQHAQHCVNASPHFFTQSAALCWLMPGKASSASRATDTHLQKQLPHQLCHRLETREPTCAQNINDRLIC